jgi:predicted DsbA family dithiol-disulfide isomerase
MRIDVFSDIACPWCFVGERRLKKALATFPDLEIDWHWRAFQLQPQMPLRGFEWQSFIVQKFGGANQRDAAFAHVVESGRLEGIVFDFVKMPVAPNTVNAHRLVLMAQQSGAGQAVAEALFKAYFTDAQDITDPSVLESIGAAHGLEAVTAMLETDLYVSDVHDAQQEASQLGVTGVPFIVFDERYALSGAQPLEVFQRAIQTAMDAQPRA